ncbi:hypothetical protein [Tabrizicola sp.]|uniref:hypothetical protein n=1 Tax=Tabrizicola sp. TaxID=2005166 RepID=UPI00286A6304|nr:hypothetical protein [Tabrizicola sp.]
MARPKRPVFLARAPYRRRRLRDAARLLPVFGAVLMILPLLWSLDADAARLRSGDVIYFFGLWTVLILVAAVFAPGLQSGVDADDEED